MKRNNRKGSMELSAVAMAVITTIVSLFIGLYMVSQVSDVASIENTSDFYAIYTSLTTDTATIFDVLILVVIVVVLGIAIGSLRNFSGSSGGSSAI